MPNAEEYTSRQLDVGGRPINVVSYRIGDRFFCHIDNVDPGATIARAEGTTRDEAEQTALEKATSRMPGGSIR